MDWTFDCLPQLPAFIALSVSKLVFREETFMSDSARTLKLLYQNYMKSSAIWIYLKVLGSNQGKQQTILFGESLRFPWSATLRELSMFFF